MTGAEGVRHAVAAPQSKQSTGVARLALAALCAALCLSGCALLPRNAVPVPLMPDAVIPGMPDVRAAAGRINAPMMRDLARSFEEESPVDFPVGPDGFVHYAHLALSGGGANGAFGAGLLNGWTKQGTRPTFKLVTGVSTGALMAPFAFLGPRYDEALREFYTTTATRNIFRMLSIIPQLLRGESLADTTPLRALIEQHVDETFLRAVAAAHRNGRRLYIGTADLDSQRFVVWNMGLIAAYGTPEALDLFRSVMLASASIPVAFPPVYFEVEAGGRRFDEMHVDGGVAANIFYTAGVFSFLTAREGVGRGQGREDIYIIHNGQLRSVPEATSRSLRSIATRVFDSVVKAGTLGDLFRIYANSVREGAGYRWITMPEGVELTGDEAFDPVKMNELFELGYRKALEGPRWLLAPPGFAPRAEP
jgi:predicted acylesterase/phospholipase RssA